MCVEDGSPLRLGCKLCRSTELQVFSSLLGKFVGFATIVVIGSSFILFLHGTHVSQLLCFTVLHISRDDSRDFGSYATLHSVL